MVPNAITGPLNGSPNHASSSNIPSNQPTIFHQSLTATILTADVPSKILRTGLSAITFVSDRWSVDAQ